MEEANTLHPMGQLLFDIIIITAAYYYKTRRKMHRRRRFGIRPVFRRRLRLGEYSNFFAEIKSGDPQIFFKYTRMTVPVFEHLLTLVKQRLTKTCRTSRVIDPEQRLAITLRYLSTGDSMQSSGLAYRISKQAVSVIIPETCKVLWDVLQPLYLKPPTQAQWKDIVEGFESQWNLPHCVGAVDGKLINIQCPKNFGSLCYNSKQSHSVVLLGVCDANYNFTYVDIGAYGACSNGGVLQQSELGIAMSDNVLNLPTANRLPNSDLQFPYFFVGDEAFPLREDLLRPYPGRHVTISQRIFNYRLSRARRVIENTFGILSSRWRVFRKPIIAKVETVNSIVQACVVLHNYIQSTDAKQAYCPPHMVDLELENGIIRPGDWRTKIIDRRAMQKFGRLGSNNRSRNVSQLRDQFAHYLCTTGAVPWQLNIVNRGAEPGYEG